MKTSYDKFEKSTTKYLNFTLVARDTMNRGRGLGYNFIFSHTSNNNFIDFSIRLDKGFKLVTDGMFPPIILENRVKILFDNGETCSISGYGAPTERFSGRLLKGNSNDEKLLNKLSTNKISAIRLKTADSDQNFDFDLTQEDKVTLLNAFKCIR
jgi:hypothetical protein